MALDVASLFAKYNEVADLLITDVNHTPVELFYANQQLSPSNQTVVQPMTTSDYFGGQAPISDLQGRQDQSATGVYPGTNSNIVYCRVYWMNSKYDPVMKELRTDKSESICKINCFTTDAFALRNAAYAVVNGYRVTMTDPPIPYGFGKRYSFSYWQIAE